MPHTKIQRRGHKKGRIGNWGLGRLSKGTDEGDVDENNHFAVRK